MNRVVLIGIAGLVVLAAAIALNYRNGREPGEEPVFAEPTGASAPAAPQQPVTAQVSAEADGASSAAQVGVADAPGDEDGAPSAAESGASGSLSDQGTVAAQPASPGGEAAPAVTSEAPSGGENPVPATIVAQASEQVRTLTEPVEDAQTPEATDTVAAAPTAEATPDREAAHAQESEPGQVAETPVQASPEAPAQASPEVDEAEAHETPNATEVAPAETQVPAETQAAAVDATVEIEAPAIVVSPEALEVPPQAPSFDVVRINPRGDAVLAGRAEPDAEVTIHDDGEEIGRVMADSRGEWVFVPTEPLPPGSRELSLSARHGEEAEVLSDDTIVLVVPEPGKNVAGAVTGGAPSGTLALQIPRPGGMSEADEAPVATKVLQTPSGEEPAPEELALRTVDYSGSGQLVLSGNAPSRARLQVYLDDSLIGIAEAEEGGEWQLVPEGWVEAGVYTMRVDQVDAGGKVISRIELPFARAEPVVALPEETIIVVQPGDSLWQIARGTYGAGIKYTVIYDSNRDQIRDPHLIYPGQIFTLERIN